MRVYVETNFLLEMVFEQEESESAERLLRGAQQGILRFRLPAISRFEALDALKRRIRERESFTALLREQGRQLRRQRPLQEEKATEKVLDLLAQSTQNLEDRLDHYLGLTLSVAHLIPLTAREEAIARRLLSETRLETFDAMVMGCVLGDLDGSPTTMAVFANRNKNDFDVPDVRALLNERGCRLLNGFESAVQHIQRSYGLPTWA